MLPVCQVCGKKEQILKRCTRCRKVFYCSRECQVKDWSKHKRCCHEEENVRTEEIQHAANSEQDIWNQTDFESEAVDSTNVKVQQGSTTITYKRPVDFQTAFDKLATCQAKCNGSKNPLAVHQKEITKQPTNIYEDNLPCKKQSTRNDQVCNKCYLLNNKMYSDVPMLDESQPHTIVTIKYKNKVQVKLQESWNGEDIMKVICANICVALDALKLVHKGRFVNSDSIKDFIKPKAVFQAIGEQAENEDGVDVGDIEVIMKQLHVDRNTAVKALKNTGDIVDAIFEISNK